ncbi:putative C6 transcription factor [Xylogone sp. PMI_703]|nr:putative C6 transcription factor [Xylogone sp. PMI_703]
MRCLASKRTCGGYENDVHVIFRQYQGYYDKDPISVKLVPRKCSLPIRTSIPGTDVIPEDGPPKEVPDEKMEEFALRAFFHDYSIISANSSLSRGFLGSIESILHCLGLESDLAKACTAVSMASHGLKLKRPYLLQKAENLYNNLLTSLARIIETSAYINNGEALLIATLLGLYEMITAREAHPGHHVAHAKGVAAILHIDNSLLNIFGAMHTIRCGYQAIVNRTAANPTTISTPNCTSSLSLDELWTTLFTFWQKWGYLLEDSPIALENPHMVIDELLVFDETIVRWQDSQLRQFGPRVVRYITQALAGSEPAAGFWPGRVDAYFDLCIAGIWNISRIARCLLRSLVVKLSKIFNPNVDLSCHYQDILDLIDDVVASIPYHLTFDIHKFLNNTSSAICPGISGAGLLLMHPLYFASTLEFIPPKMASYLKVCLAWIGTHMGIGQASIFAKASELDSAYVASGCMIIWTGLLI